MNQQELLSDLRGLAAALTGSNWVAPVWRTARWHIHSWTIDTPQAVRDRVQGFNEASVGWIETTDVATNWRGGQPWPAGTLLNAELAAGDRSLMVRELEGRWLLCEMQVMGSEVQMEQQSALGQTVEGLSCVRHQLRQDLPRAAWQHEVLIRASESGEITEVAARLLAPESAREQ